MAAFAGTAADLSRQVRHAGLDAGECFRVRDLRFARDEVKIYFTEGHLIFGKPVNGRRISAVFSGEVEGGDAELLLLPPFARERQSLASFAKTPNLNEHFRLAVMVFSDGTAAELLRLVRNSGAAREPETGHLLSSKWGELTASLSGSFEVRLVEDLLSARPDEQGFFFAAISGNTLGNFDVVWDPKARRQIMLGQVAFRDERRYFDIWTNFEAQPWRRGARKTAEDNFRVDRVQIDATIDPELKLSAVTRLRLRPLTAARVIPLEVSPRMTVQEVSIDGVPAEAFAPESLRANLLRSMDNHTVLVLADRELPGGAPVELTIKHEGGVITPAGDRIYFVGARGAWYPNRPRQFATYETVYRFPKDLHLVATGELVSEVEEGDMKIARRRTSSPVRFAGFNLGDFERVQVKRSGLVVEVCANRTLERALQQPPRPVAVTPLPAPVWPRNRRQQTTDIVMLPPIQPNPTARLQSIAGEVAGVFEELAARFGKPPLPLLTVSPIPGRFGQGFPGLVYLSTMAYLDPKDVPVQTPGQRTFFLELLHAHEVAHQWWGNGVTSADYQDDWLMEALANYSALWMLERKKGVKALDTVLDQYRDHLLQKQEDGRTVESAGPVTMGQRLISSQSPNAWSVITYEKGSWILHMLRRRLGDAAFQKMLAQLYEQRRFQAVSTEQFQQLAVAHLPPKYEDPKLENFFEQWVNGTGVPELKLKWTIAGRAPRVSLKGTLTQSEVDENFATWVPVEIQPSRGKPIVKWVLSAAEPVEFTVPLAAPPTRVALDPASAVLARK